MTNSIKQKKLCVRKWSDAIYAFCFMTKKRFKSDFTVDYPFILKTIIFGNKIIAICLL